jgi:hypothetical protein
MKGAKVITVKVKKGNADIKKALQEFIKQVEKEKRYYF